jgi:hypothetical protein
MNERIKNIWSTFYLVILFSLFIKCNLDNVKKTIPIFKENPRKVIVVMCDITRSLDTNSIRKVTDLALIILNKSEEADVIYFPVDSNLYVNPILFKETYKGMTFGQRQDSLKSHRKRLQESIVNNYINRNARESCVLKGFNIAYTMFKQYSPPGDYSFHLVFLSDMLECCEYKFGKLNLEKPSSYDLTIQNLEQYKPVFNLKGMNVTITVVMTAFRQLPIDESLHKEFWRLALNTMGYENKDFDNILFCTNLPKEF